MTNQDQGDYLTLRETAALLKLDQRTILRYEDQGLITSLRLPGGGRRYLEQDVRALLSTPQRDASAAS